MLDTLTADDFRPHLGVTFQLTPEGGAPIATELVEVADHPAPEDLRAPFSLLFKGPFDAEAEQGTYRVERDGGDAVDLFLVPVGPTATGDGLLYEAVFA